MFDKFSPRAIYYFSSNSIPRICVALEQTGTMILEGVSCIKICGNHDFYASVEISHCQGVIQTTLSHRALDDIIATHEPIVELV